MRLQAALVSASVRLNIAAVEVGIMVELEILLRLQFKVVQLVDH